MVFEQKLYKLRKESLENLLDIQTRNDIGDDVRKEMVQYHRQKFNYYNNLYKIVYRK